MFSFHSRHLTLPDDSFSLFHSSTIRYSFILYYVVDRQCHSFIMFHTFHFCSCLHCLTHSLCHDLELLGGIWHSPRARRWKIPPRLLAPITILYITYWWSHSGDILHGDAVHSWEADHTTTSHWNTVEVMMGRWSPSDGRLGIQFWWHRPLTTGDLMWSHSEPCLLDWAVGVPLFHCTTCHLITFIL